MSRSGTPSTPAFLCRFAIFWGEDYSFGLQTSACAEGGPVKSKLALMAAGMLLLFAHPVSAEASKDHVRGGGQVEFACPENSAATGFQNVSIEAHVDTGTTTDGVSGHFNSTIPKQNGCIAAGQLRVDIDCLQVVGNHADLTGRITKLTGFFTSPGFQFTEGGRISISATDNSPLLADTIGAVRPRPMTMMNPCGFRSPDEQPLARGNIQIDMGS